MRWRDIRFEKPTKEDGDEYGNVLQRLTDGIVVREQWDELTAVVAWMPLSELPQPDLPGLIPDGWRAVDRAVDKRTSNAKCWLEETGWIPVNPANEAWEEETAYIVPIDPPAPQYRAFANAAEFMPHADRWISRLHDANKKAAGAYRPFGYDDLGIWGESGRECFKEMLSKGRKFADDGTPFGVLIETNQ